MLNLFKADCGKSGDNTTVRTVGNVINDTLVRRHEGPIIRGTIKVDGVFSKTEIYGNVDKKFFEFKLFVVCNLVRLSFFLFNLVKIFSAKEYI